MSQSSINQRIKFIIDHIGLSARAFSELIGESPTNTQNYVGKRNSMPGADYIEKILSHFESISPIWLTTGKGEPFLAGAEPTANIKVKKNKGQTIGVNHGTATQYSYSTLADCEKELLSCQTQLAEAITKLNQCEQERTAMARELEVMRELVKAKDEMILLLKGGYNRPN